MFALPLGIGSPAGWLDVGPEPACPAVFTPALPSEDAVPRYQ